MNPKISVIITAYNSEKYLEKCLDSIYNQTFKDFEVILVNDGSIDNTKNIVKYYASLHDNIILINQENNGVSVARNNAIKVCRGEYITFSDSDDYVEPNWLQSFIDIINIHPKCELVVEGFIIDYLHHKNYANTCKRVYESNNIMNAYITLHNHYIGGFLFNKLYKKRIIEKEHIQFEYSLKEDILFNLKYFYHINSVITTPVMCYHYVQHSDSLVHKRYPADYMRRLITAIFDASIQLCEKFSEKDFQENVIEDYLLSYSVLLFSMYSKNIGIKNRTERLEYIKEYQNIRRNNQNVKISKGSKVKRLFASFMMLPPKLTDYIMSIVKYNIR